MKKTILTESILPPVPEQDAWALEMYGTCVSFVSNAEKQQGMSPGACTKMYTEAKMKEYANSVIQLTIQHLTLDQ